MTKTKLPPIQRDWVSKTLAGTLLQLTPREGAALSVLLARSGSPVEKSHLSGKVFPADSNAGPDAIELVLHRLRRKLADLYAAFSEPMD